MPGAVSSALDKRGTGEAGLSEDEAAVAQDREPEWLRWVPGRIELLLEEMRAVGRDRVIQGRARLDSWNGSRATTRQEKRNSRRRRGAARKRRVRWEAAWVPTVTAPVQLLQSSRRDTAGTPVGDRNQRFRDQFISEEREADVFLTRANRFGRGHLDKPANSH